MSLIVGARSAARASARASVLKKNNPNVNSITWTRIQSWLHAGEGILNREFPLVLSQSCVGRIKMKYLFVALSALFIGMAYAPTANALPRCGPGVISPGCVRGPHMKNPQLVRSHHRHQSHLQQRRPRGQS
jgi:hypothetical protein